MKHAYFTSFIALLSMAVFSTMAFSSLQNTDAIQQAIDTAAPGDTIEVAAGIYQGTLTLNNGVALVGPEEGAAIIDGGNAPVTIQGAADCILSNLTIKGGKIAVEMKSTFMGIFDCTIEGQNRIAIHVCGGSAAIINNIVKNGSIHCNSSNPLIACNTIITSKSDGIWSWYAPGPTAINNCVVGARHGITAGAGAKPVLERNALWMNKIDVKGCDGNDTSLTEAPLFVDQGKGDLRLAANSPLVKAGQVIEGLWDNVTPDIGWNSGKNLSVEECRAFIDLILPEILANAPTVYYTLGEDPDLFLVTVQYPRKKFSIRSSTKDTIITDIDAYDELEEHELQATLVEEEQPRVNVKGAVSQQATTIVAPVPADGETITNRYVLSNVYDHPDSYFDSEDGLRVFRRTTNLFRAIVEIPEGYIAVYASINGVPLEGELGIDIEFLSPGLKEIEVGLKPKQSATLIEDTPIE